MKNKVLVPKISVVTTSILTGLFLVGTVIASENTNAINNALNIIPLKRVETGDSNADTEYYKSKFKSVKELFDEGTKTCEEIEAEGATLIKNENNALPLSKGNKVSLMGISSIDIAYGGKGSAQAQGAGDPIDLQEGLTAAGLDVNPTATAFYKSNNSYKRSGRGSSARINDAPIADINANADLLSSLQTYGDAAIFTLSRPGGGEGSDFSSTGTDGENGDYLRLNQNEKDCLKLLKSYKDQGKIKKIIILLNTSNQPECDFLDNSEYGIDSALWIGNTGISGLAAVGKILVGDINPSGHLSDTMWYSHADNPVQNNFGAYKYPNAGDYEIPESNKYSTYVTYQEGIYLGYRYTETRYYDVVRKRAKAGTFDYANTVYRPFGYGESYTTFEYSNFKVETEHKKFKVTVDVKNTGSVAGKDAVQIYASKPYTEYDVQNHIEKAAVELVGFAKTGLIEAGKTQTVEIDIDKYNLTSFDAYNFGTYIIEKGEYKLTAAQDSHEAVNNILAQQGFTSADGMVGQGNSNLVKTFSLNEDTTSYSKSKATGNEVKSLFAEADINRYHGKGDNEVTYLSRNDWQGTYPTSEVKLNMTGALAKDLVDQENPKLIEPSGEELPPMGVNKGLTLIDLMQDTEGNPIPETSALWDEFVQQLTFDQLQDLVGVGLRKTIGITEINKPETVEHNGPLGLVLSYGNNKDGLAARTEDPDKNLVPPYYPNIGLLAATFNKDLATKFGDMMGEDSIWAGFAGLYGIGLNTHRSAYEGRAYEYWSEDPLLSGEMVACEVKALQSHGCNGYIKHFALNEQETQRNSICVWLNEQTLREIYLKPFEYAVIEGGANNAMVSFSRIGAVNCTASKTLLTDFLRGELGMKGLVITDMYQIGYTQEQFPCFLMAGVDLCDGELKKAFNLDYLKNNANVVKQLQTAAKRILYSTLHSNAMNGISITTKFVPYTPGWKIALYSVDAVFGALFLASIAFAVLVFVKSKKVA